MKKYRIKKGNGRKESFLQSLNGKPGLWGTGNDYVFDTLEAVQKELDFRSNYHSDLSIHSACGSSRSFDCDPECECDDCQIMIDGESIDHEWESA
jgi:hypothetical protein